ncbi:MAG: diguanylate cyclase [Gemmatimonadetes bacterium]|nr:diguanylate cyclase [Gemmatimonadota bacterium]
MGSILILSDDKAVVEDVEKAISGSHAITVLPPEPATLDCSTTARVDLVFLKDRSGSVNMDFLETVISWFRAQDIPVLLFREPESPRQPPNLEGTVGDYLSLPVDSSEVAGRTELLLKVKQRLDELGSKAVIDELTGAYNRRYLHEQLKLRLGEARRHRTPVSFILFDLDHFKNVNDSHGHLFGDTVLKGTADLVRQLIRKEDLLARYGGEEFAVMLPHTDRFGAAVLAERLRESAAGCYHSNGERKERVTISLGVASFPTDEADSVEELIECADWRLYKAKYSGRNRSVFS